MSLDINLRGEFAITKNLDQLALGNETGCDEVSNGNLLNLLGISNGLNNVEVDGLVLYTVDVLETKLRYTTLQRHLATLETNLL